MVPSHWHDTVDYQQSQNERDRAATILDKKIMRTIDNLPFLHMALIEMRDTETLGGLKKAIRLCKNVRSDAERSISLQASTSRPPCITRTGMPLSTDMRTS